MQINLPAILNNRMIRKEMIQARLLFYYKFDLLMYINTVTTGH